MTNNGLLATKNKGGDNWNCVIIGDKEIPKNKISKWKIQIKTDVYNGYSDLHIGIGPNKFNKSTLYTQCWSIYSRNSYAYLNLRDKQSEYNNHKDKLKKRYY